MAPHTPQSEKTIFKRIIDGELPCSKVFENERILAFRDINPQAPVHILIIPKKEIKNIADIAPSDQALIGEMLLVAQEIAKKEGIFDNFRLVTNSGPEAGQIIYHLHFHLLGGKKLGHLC